MGRTSLFLAGPAGRAPAEFLEGFTSDHTFAVPVASSGNEDDEDEDNDEDEDDDEDEEDDDEDDDED